MTHPDPVVSEIAARYGAKVSPDLTVQRIPPGVSAYALIWDGRALVSAVPQEKSWGHPMGRPPSPVEVAGHRWPSQKACAYALGVSPEAVSKAIQKGKLAELVARRFGPKCGGSDHAA